MSENGPTANTKTGLKPKTAISKISEDAKHRQTPGMFGAAEMVENQCFDESHNTRCRWCLQVVHQLEALVPEAPATRRHASVGVHQQVEMQW